MAFEGKKSSGDIHDHTCCTIHLNNNDLDDDEGQQEKVVRGFYFAKINKYFPDPDLQAHLNAAMKLKEQREIRQARLLNNIQPLKVKVESLTKGVNARDLYVENLWRDVEFNRRYLEKHWPESINEDIQEEPDPDIELIELKEKIPKLTERLGHGKTNWAKEKEILKEVEHLRRRVELLDRQVKEAEAKIPEPRWSYWRYGSKYDMKRKIRNYMKEITKHEEQKKVAKMLEKQEIAKMEKQIAGLQKKSYNLAKQEDEREMDCVMALEIQVKKEIAIYDRYCKILSKAKELAAENDLVTLEELSHKEVEEFISRWTSDDAFRANYTRSIQHSLANRGFTSDGRMQDPSQMTTPSHYNNV